MKLTSSNFAAAIGLNPYQSRQKLWRCLNGLESRPFVAAMQWGIDHESDAVAGLEALTGRFLRETGDRQKHYTIMGNDESWTYGSTPDGRDGSVGAEVKCPGKMWDDPPLYYLPQLIGQAHIAGFDEILFSAWTPEDQRVWVYKHDPAYWEWMEPLLSKFMQDWDEGVEPKRAKKPALPDIVLEVYDADH